MSQTSCETCGCDGEGGKLDTTAICLDCIAQGLKDIEPHVATLSDQWLRVNNA